MMIPLKDALTSAGLQPDQIDDIVMVGGTTRIPYIRHEIEKFFNKELNYQDHPDEAIGDGAAVYGDMLLKGRSLEFKKTTNKAIGVEVYDPEKNEDVMDEVFPKDTSFPVSKIRDYVTHIDDQQKMIIELVQRKEKGQPYQSLGEMKIDGFAAGPKGQQRIRVTFTIDEAGKLSVTAKDLNRDDDAGCELHVEESVQSRSFEELREMAQKSKNERMEQEERKE